MLKVTMENEGGELDSVVVNTGEQAVDALVKMITEIATARYRLLGDVEEMAMYLPPLSEYVNLHPHTFHLYEHQRSSLILAGR